MLVLTRRLGERVRIGDDITVMVLSAYPKGYVKLGFEAPEHVSIAREEIADAVRRKRHRKEAAEPPRQEDSPSRASEAGEGVSFPAEVDPVRAMDEDITILWQEVSDIDAAVESLKEKTNWLRRRLRSLREAKK